MRRAKIVVTDGLTQLRNAYPKSEFIRSTDPLFRPVSIHNAPDGSLYLVDMYTGIIQDAQFVGPQSYLRKKVEQYDLDKIHNYGRIWRITYEGTAPDRTQPRMYSETAAQLVQHLEHPNGWWRDTAQKLLVLKQDKSVVPTLKTMARTSANQLARIHALWTLEGLGSLDAALVRELMKSPDPLIRIQAIRASESLYKARDKSFAADYKAMTRDPDANVVIQAMLTLNLHKVPDYASVIRSTSETSIVRGIHEIGSQILKPQTSQGQRPSLADVGAGSVNMSTDERRSMTRGDGIYRELCFTCHGADGKGTPMGGATDGSTLAPPLAGSPRVLDHRNYIINVLLHGLTGPVGRQELPGWHHGADGQQFGRVDRRRLVLRAQQLRQPRDVRHSPAGRGGEESQHAKAPWTAGELEAAVPRLLTNTSQWKATASANAEAAANVVTAGAGRWDTAGPQQPGMWFQVELPEATNVAEVQIDAAAPGGGFLVLTPPGRARRQVRHLRVRRRVAARRRPLAEDVDGADSSRPPEVRSATVCSFPWMERRGESGRAGRRRDSHDHHDVCPGTGEIHPNHADRHRGEQRDLGYPADAGLCANRPVTNSPFDRRRRGSSSRRSHPRRLGWCW